MPPAKPDTLPENGTATAMKEEKNPNTPISMVPLKQETPKFFIFIFF